MAMRSMGRRSGMLAGGAVLGLLTLALIMAYQMRAGSAHADGLTLDPNQFQGDTKLAYEAAQKHPDLLAQMHCYCGCQEHEGHKNLLECFRTNHGAECATCMGEAITAAQMDEAGSPIEQIADALRKQYGSGG
jgi:uncharacterized protein with PCYCGC motif